MWFFRRRTKQSGPLGELFDHGVDACNTTLEVLIFAASQNLGQGWMTVLVLFTCELHYCPPVLHAIGYARTKWQAQYYIVMHKAEK